MCDCRAFEKYIEKTGADRPLIDVKVIKTKERRATKKFETEINHIIAGLYNTEMCPADDRQLINSLKCLRDRKTLRILAR